MNTNMNKYKDFLDMYEMYSDMAEKVLEIKGFKGSIDSIEFDSKEIEITTVEHSHCGCCSDEYEYHTLTIEELFSDIETLEKEKLEKEEKKKLEEEKKKRLQEKRDIEEKERLYLKLKKELKK